MSKSHGLSGTPEYRIWNGMVQRCTKPTCKSFARYGGRGITIHGPWLADAAAFIQYIGPKPSPQHTLDRIDNDRGYVPGNLRWATPTEQTHNRRRTKLTGRVDANDVRLIRYWLSQGYKPRRIALAFEIDRRSVDRIGNRLTWKDV